MYLSNRTVTVLWAAAARRSLHHLITHRCRRFFSRPLDPDLLCGPPYFLFSANRSGGKGYRGVKLTNHLHQQLILWMNGPYLFPPPLISLWLSQGLPLFYFTNGTLSFSSVALQPGMGLGLLYNTPPGLSIPYSVSPFLHPHVSQVRGHVIQPSHFWSSSSSCCIQLSVHLFWNCGVLHSFYVTKPSYSLPFNEPHNVLPLNYSF